MSNHQYDRARSDAESIPRFEPWLRVLASSLVPAVLALYLHSSFLIPSIVATVLLFVSGLVMLRRDTVRRRLREQQPLELESL